MKLHLQRLAVGAVILAILLGVLWIGVHNDQLLNTILYVVSFCVISYLIGYFLLKIKIGMWLKKFNTMKKPFIRVLKNKKIESNDSGRAAYRKNRKRQRSAGNNNRLL